MTKKRYLGCDKWTGFTCPTCLNNTTEHIPNPATKIEKQEAALKAALEFLPESRWEGGTELGYNKRSGTALLEARRKVLEALK